MPTKKNVKGGKGGKGKAAPKVPSTEIVEPEVKPPILRTISKPNQVSFTNKVTADSQPCPEQCNCYQPLNHKDPGHRTKPKFIYGGPFKEPKMLSSRSDYERENDALKALDLFKFRKRLVVPILPPERPKAN